MLGKAEKRCIDTIIAITGRFLTYEEVAELIGCHPNTAKNTIYALYRGGLGIQKDKTGRFMTPNRGRYRNLIKLGEVTE